MKKYLHVLKFCAKKPMIRGMIAYSVIWPSGATISQLIQGKKINQIDWLTSFRYGLWGSLFVAPTLYGWIRITTHMWPMMNLKTGITKAIIEQATYGPASMVCFFFGMSILEMKSFDESVTEVKEKFIPSWKVAVCFWPIVQTINFSVIKEKNRVPFVSVASLCWTVFLAYMHHLESKKEHNEYEEKCNIKL